MVTVSAFANVVQCTCVPGCKWCFYRSGYTVWPCYLHDSFGIKHTNNLAECPKFWTMVISDTRYRKLPTLYLIQNLRRRWGFLFFHQCVDAFATRENEQKTYVALNFDLSRNIQLKRHWNAIYHDLITAIVHTVFYLNFFCFFSVFFLFFIRLPMDVSLNTLMRLSALYSVESIPNDVVKKNRRKK